MIQVHPARSSRITHLHIYMYTYIHIYVSLYTHLCTIIFILGTLYRSRISCDACLGGLNAIARACCLTFTPPNNRGYTAYVNVNPCTRGIQAMLYYVRVYPWTYARMDYRWTCVRVEYSRKWEQKHAWLCVRLCIFMPSVSDHVMSNVFLADSRRS